jgi:hypothetical protein
MLGGPRGHAEETRDYEMPPAVNALLRPLAVIVAWTIATVCASPAVGADEFALGRILYARGLDLTFQREFPPAVGRSAQVEGRVLSAPLGAVLGLGARPPAAPAGDGPDDHEPAILARLPFSLQGGDAVVKTGRWQLRVGAGATPSRTAGRADLSPTRVVTGAAVGANGGNVQLQRDRAGPRVGELFANFSGLGHRRRARVDIDLAPTRIAASFDVGGRADAAIAHAGRWQGFDTEARAALVTDRTLRLESSAAVRDRASGWSFNVAAMGAPTATAGRTPASLYAKLARAADREGPITAAWSLEGAFGRDVAREGDRAWLAGATLLQRFEGLGRLHLRYRYQSLDGEAGREGHAHAVTVGLRLRL